MIVKQEDGGRKRMIKEDEVIYQTLSVTRSGLAAESRPRVQFNGEWLSEFGFENGVLIQALPEWEGLVFNLCDKNITYSELYRGTRERGGTLNRAYISGTRTQKGVTFVTTGRHISRSGLKCGDALIAKCEYGCIRVRKVNGNIRLINVAKTKRPYTNEPAPMVFLLGDWLGEIGFAPDILMTVASEPGIITFTAYEKAVIYSEIVKYARQNKMQLVQVSTKEGSPLITLTGNRITNAGFSLGDIFLAEYEYGVIKLQKLEPERFGFAEAESRRE